MKIIQIGRVEINSISSCCQLNENVTFRNPNDANAHSKFQKIGSAYQILSDDNLRAAYDKKGKEAIENTNVIDAASLYALFFGSGNS